MLHVFQISYLAPQFCLGLCRVLKGCDRMRVCSPEKAPLEKWQIFSSKFFQGGSQRKTDPFVVDVSDVACCFVFWVQLLFCTLPLLLVSGSFLQSVLWIVLEQAVSCVRESGMPYVLNPQREQTA